jgi:hypothetical protein
VQWEARSIPRLTHRSGVQADIIQAIWANAMQSEERVMIWDAAAVILANVLGLRESSVMSLSAKKITHTAAKMTVRLVLVKGKAIRHAVLATYARTGVAGNVRTDRRCYLTIAHRPVAEVDWSAACARFALRLARRWK